MVIDKTTPYGGINITMEAIASVAGDAASECYGVVGLASKNSLRENINELLKRDDFIKGVYCRRKKKDQYEVDVYIIVAYGVKITEVLSEVQKKVTYVLEKTFPIKFQHVNVFVQDIKEIE
jgi:uncharacterized alkaline shock family protein YloU